MAEHGGGSVPAFLTLFQTKTTSLVQKGKKGKKEEEPSFEELLPFIKECQKELKEKEPTHKCALLDPNSCKKEDEEDFKEAVKEESVENPCKECEGAIMPCVKTKFMAKAMAKQDSAKHAAFLTLFQTETTSLVQRGLESSFEELLPFIKECQKELKEKEPTHKCALLDPKLCKEEDFKEAVKEESGEDTCKECEDAVMPCVQEKFMAEHSGAKHAAFLTLFQTKTTSLVQSIPTKEECMQVMCGDHSMVEGGKTFITQTNDETKCKAFAAKGNSCNVVHKEGRSECHYNPCSSEHSQACAAEFGHHNLGDCQQNKGPSFEELLPFIKECQKELKEKEPTNKCALLDPNSCKEEAVKEEEVKDIQ